MPFDLGLIKLKSGQFLSWAKRNDRIIEGLPSIDFFEIGLQ